MERVQDKDKNKTMEDTFQKLKFIFSQDKKDQTANDYLYKYQLKILFVPKENSFELAFDKESNIAQLIIKLVDFLALVFSMPKMKRESFYNLNIFNITDNKFLEIIRQLEKVQSFDIDFENHKLANLFKIISNALDQKPVYSISEYIDSILVNLSFVPGLELLLKYQLYLMLHTYYLNPIHVTLDFSENEINISDDTPLDLITELFSKKQNDVEYAIKSIIYLNYGSLENSIQNYNIDEILSAIDAVNLKLKKIKNIGNLSLCVEKITTRFIDELKRLKNQKSKNKKKKKKKSKKLDDKEKIKQEVKENMSGESSKNEANKINLNEGITDEKPDKDANKIIESVDAQNNKKDKSINKDYLNQSGNLINYINNIINYINTNNMGNENINKDIKNIQNIIINIVEENRKMKGKIEEMNQNIINLNNQNLKQSQELKKQSQELKKQSQDIKELKENVDFLTEECQDMKEILGNIQYRDLSKNFLRSFSTFLSDEDWRLIKKDKTKKGELIIERIEEKYPKAGKQKMSIVKKLIKNSFNLIQEGNYLAHSQTLDKYEDEINAYKKKKNLKNLTSPIAFCFLVNLGISDDLFDNAYSFVTKFFNSDLFSTNGKTLLDLYFK